ncbi:MAG TPA: DUF642 domain-containing protein [Burkholderiaceae bacterium]|nr:DUF642 domain-containing protein [Burkholderiaceae bacterium]
MSKKFLIALGLSAASLLAQAAPINLISNGSFESVSLAKGSWATLSSLAGWTVGPQKVELRNNVAGSAFAGLNFVELDTNRNSWISQTFSTVAGSTYHLSFMWANRPDQVGANSNGISWQVNALSGVVGNSTKTTWTVFEQDFVATGASTTLRFGATGTSDGMGTSLDAVSVTSKIPEPGSLALLAMAAGALFVARRRKA